MKDTERDDTTAPLVEARVMQGNPEPLTDILDWFNGVVGFVALRAVVLGAIYVAFHFIVKYW